MDLDRMLRMCRRDQWSIQDLDWSVVPRALPREQEMAVVQYFVDMAGIELLAGELFKVQRDQTEDPVLREIFDTFVVDELRHSEVAMRLAAHYDVHRYRSYARSPELVAFAGPFVDAVHHLAPDLANTYITTGELLLDVALLRSLNDFVADEMSEQAMALINRDESRHIAVDFHMVEHYCGPAYQEWLEKRPSKGPRQMLSATISFLRMLWYAGPFFRAVFFEPMDLTDPTGRRIKEAFKRIQLLGRRPEVLSRPFARFAALMMDIFNHPLLGPYLGPFAARALGLDPRYLTQLYTEEEREKAMKIGFMDLAQEAIDLKYAS